MLSTAVADRLETLQPAAFAELTTITRLAEQATDPKLLKLCAGYIEAALRCADWQPPTEGLSPREKAFIAFTEQFVTSVSTLEASQVSGLLEHASADEVYGFVHALYVIDMSLRLEIVGREVLA